MIVTSLAGSLTTRAEPVKLPGEWITWAAGSRVGTRAVTVGDARLRERRALVSAYMPKGWSHSSQLCTLYPFAEPDALG